MEFGISLTAQQGSRFNYFDKTFTYKSVIDLFIKLCKYMLQ